MPLLCRMLCAPCNGTTSTPPKVGCQPRPPPTTMAMCNGTQQWHHVHCTLQWHPGATSNQPKWFVLFVEMFGCSGAVEVHGFGWLWLLIKNLLSFYTGRWYPNFRFLLATILGCPSFRNWPNKFVLHDDATGRLEAPVDDSVMKPSSDHCFSDLW